MRSNSAPACSRERPGRRRAAASSWLLRRLAREAGVKAFGVQSSVAMGKSKLAGITPVTRKFWSSRRMFLPTMPGSAAKRRRHRRSLSTTSRSRPGWSSPSWKPRPSTGWTPRVVKKLALTSVCVARSGSPPAPTMLAMPPPHVARFSSVVLSRRISSRSAGLSLFHSLEFSGIRWRTITRLSRCGKAMGFHSRESQTLKTAVVAPMPSASVSTAVTAKPGDLRSMRSP